jgi:hypothetical protein
MKSSMTGQEKDNLLIQDPPLVPGTFTRLKCYLVPLDFKECFIRYTRKFHWILYIKDYKIHCNRCYILLHNKKIISIIIMLCIHC